MDRKVLVIGPRLSDKGSSGCNILGNSNVVGYNVVGGAGLGTIMVGKQASIDTALHFQHEYLLLVYCFHMERVAYHSWVVFKQDWHV